MLLSKGQLRYLVAGIMLSGKMVVRLFQKVLGCLNHLVEAGSTDKDAVDTRFY